MRCLIVVALLAFMAVGFVSARPAEDEEEAPVVSQSADNSSADVGGESSAADEVSTDQENQESDPTNKYEISTRERCGPFMQGYPFNPCLTEAQYEELKGKFYPLNGLEKAVQQQLIDNNFLLEEGNRFLQVVKVNITLSGLDDVLKGLFEPLPGLLIDDHFLFKEGDRFLQAANACRFWPRGHNDYNAFLVWCNEEDHLRIISVQQGGDLGQIYKRLLTAALWGL